LPLGFDLDAEGLVKSTRKGQRPVVAIEPSSTHDGAVLPPRLVLAVAPTVAPLPDAPRAVDVCALLGAIGDYQRELEAQNQELHQIQRQLSDSRDRYFELYELAPASHLTLDESGAIVEANQRLSALLGLPRVQYLGRPLAAFLEPEWAERLNVAVRRLQRERVRVDVELVLQRADGALRHVRFDAVPRQGTSQVRAVITDVTKLKEAESHIRTLNVELAARIDELTRANRLLAQENEHRVSLTRELERSELELRRLSRKVMTSQDDERRRLARELHDETGQSLGAIVAELRALEDRDDQPELAQVARRLRDKVSGALRDVRRLAQGLHPSALVSGGLRPALERLVADQRVLHSIEIVCQLGGFPATTRLAAPVELTLFRVAQEALTNAIKHAHARRVSVVLVAHGQHVRLVVEDDGSGFDVNDTLGASLGLVGMRERVGLVGGDMHVESGPDRGTTLAVSIPLEPVDGTDPSPHRR
jgi:PAS domain S-box-containing protein